MKIEEFFKKIEADEELSLVKAACEEKREDDYLIILYIPRQVVWEMLATTITQTEWPVVRDIFSGKREAQVLDHMTRIVGYYSKVKNFNQSKIGELRDRHAGNYRIDGKARTNAEESRSVIDSYSKKED